MKLSVIIVNYNVKYFLEQCLHSVAVAASRLDIEIIVVDNNSMDGSNAMVREKFPQVILIANKDNKGFSSANNQGIKISKGEYVLLLNPDTVVEENTFSATIKFMDEHQDAGGLGVKMLDGNGTFLPESKRGLPTPEAAFYKVFGLSKLFPNSKKFGKYQLSYLDKDQIHEIEILSGAFMMMRKCVLDKIGLLDETFFMYGEDIDLSYRILLAGYKNYYFPKTRIIHYKGESTKKSSINYVFVFYNAMIIFAKKHFSQKNARLFSALIKMAIYFRAFIAIMNRFVSRLSMPLIDLVVFWAGLLFIKREYQTYTGNIYEESLVQFALPLYAGFWLLSILINGGYRERYQLKDVIYGIASGTAAILIVYSLLSEEFRFSRAIIMLGAVYAIVAAAVTRVLLQLTGIDIFQKAKNNKQRFAIVGDIEEIARVEGVLDDSLIPTSFIARVSPTASDEQLDQRFVAHIGKLRELISVFNIDEVIFCSKNVKANEIINQMDVIGTEHVHFKIVPPESVFIIGSDSTNSTGDTYYAMEINSIGSNTNTVQKRLVDIFVSSLLIFFLPLSLILVEDKGRFISNLLNVCLGKISWVGYGDPIGQKLPKIKHGVLTPQGLTRTRKTISNADLLYAKDYKISNDIRIILNGFRNLGNEPLST